jgi:hypothetical protein
VIGEDARRHVPVGNGIWTVWAGNYIDVVHPDYGHERPIYRSMPVTVDVVLRPAGTIEGRVVDRVTGRPAAGTTVCMQAIREGGPQGGGWQRTRTDDEGKYRLPSLLAGKYNIWADAPDRTCAALDSFAVEAGKKHAAPDLGLIEGGWIEGRVIDAATGTPLGNGADRGQLQIAIRGPSRPRSGAAVQSTEVDAEGRFRIRATPGLNHPYVMHPDYNRRTENRERYQQGIEVKARKTTAVEFRILPPMFP